jgi:sugar phosphate isomerase/epimerase
MQVGCAALYPITRYGFPYTLDNYLLAIREMSAAGFQAVELEVNVDLDLVDYQARVEEVKAVLEEVEVSLSGIIGVVQQAFSLDPAAANRTIDRFAELCDLGAQLGCPTMVICAYMPDEFEKVAGTELYRGSPPLQIRLPSDFSWPKFWDNAVARFAQMCRIAAERDQLLAIENRVGDFVSTSDGVLKLVEEAAEPNGGILLDVAHTHASKEPLALVVEKLRNRLQYVHLADNDGSASHHWPAGQGTIDFKAVLGALHRIGYYGYVNVDYGGVPADKIWEEARQGRLYFESCLAQLNGQQGSNGATGH